KSVFLSEVKRELRLDNVEIFRGRMEEYHVGSLDYVVSRAVGQFDEFLRFATNSLVHGGRVVLWIGAEDVHSIVTRHSEWRWDKPHLIPNSQRRIILVGTPS